MRKVDEAARKQMERENLVTTPSSVMVDFAELLVDTVHTADWAFFAKNGSDVTTLAMMTARAYTHKKKMVFFHGCYHGVSPWSQKIDYPGIIEEDVCNSIYVDWNDYEQLEQVFRENEGQIAGLMAQPYMHGNFKDNELPLEGYWKKVRKLCTEHDVVLIIDDVRAGFRLDLKGSDHYFGFEADLICFCKALANGYSLSSLCGKNFLKNTVSSLSYTGSYWMSAVPFAAGIACINKMKRLNCPQMLRKKGEKIGYGLKSIATRYGFDLHVSGAPSLFYLRIADDPSLKLHQEWVAECVSRGIYFTNHHNHFVNASLTEEDITRTFEVADEAFRLLRERNS